MIFPECTTIDCNRTIKVFRHKSTFYLENQERIEICKTELDKCSFASNKKKCDWILSYELENKFAHFVELKGSHVEEALPQLLSTLKMTEEAFYGYIKCCHIVCSKVPSKGPSAQQICKRFRKDNLIPLKIGKLKDTIIAGKV